MKFIRLITCENSIEANIIKGRLESEELKCFLTNENFSNMLPQYNRMLGAGVQVMVNANDYEKAVEVLELNVNKPPICPSCSSANIRLSLGNNKGKKISTMLLSIFSGVPFNNVNNVYHCDDCKAEFSV
jgi:hypothetical protein